MKLNSPVVSQTFPDNEHLKITDNEHNVSDLGLIPPVNYTLLFVFLEFTLTVALTKKYVWLKLYTAFHFPTNK